MSLAMGSHTNIAVVMQFGICIAFERVLVLLTLWIGWYANPLCLSCAEVNLCQMIRLIEPCPALGLKCERHAPLLDLETTCPTNTDSRELGKPPQRDRHSNGTR